ncbi:MAG: methyltransferase [Actinomycetia bacterium]|nr:methyltransferase [Actinomycetes bacterium]MCP5031048.1 methyltransferase [Actinomycetes bacterium]
MTAEANDTNTPSRSRVRETLAHREPDAIPIDFGSTPVTGVHVTIVDQLRSHYGLERLPIKVHEPYQMLGMIDDDLKRAIGVDVEGVPPRETMFGFRNDSWKPWTTNHGLDVLVSGDFVTTVDDRGDTLIYPLGNIDAPPSGRMPRTGHFFDTIVRQEEIVEAELDPSDNLEEFNFVTDDDLDDFQHDVDEAVTTGRAVVALLGGLALGDISLVTAPNLEHPRGIRDITEWYVSIKKRPDYVRSIFEAQVEIALENLERIHGRVGDQLDVVMTCGTDFGTQNSAFCSLETFDTLWFPYYKRLNDWIHENTTWKTFKHSCGSVENFIPSFIECGFDVLNPVQCSAKNMEAPHLKKEYGRDIVFWGGGVDTQSTLPFGTPGEVRKEVLERCEIFAPGGGFVFNSIHNVQALTPMENILAVIDAVHEFNGTT